MPRMVVPKYEFNRILRKRRGCRGDRCDEVWNGVYVMSPIPNADIEHQTVLTHLSFAITNVLNWTGDGREDWSLYFGVKVTDQTEDWKQNYRVPDLALYLPGNPAQDLKTHYFGGPDFAVEIVSRGDRTRKKFQFYARVGVRELLIVDRYPWKLEIYRLVGGSFQRIGESSLEFSTILPSTVLPMTLRIIAKDGLPRIEVTRADGSESWLA